MRPFIGTTALCLALVVAPGRARSDDEVVMIEAEAAGDQATQPLSPEPTTAPPPIAAYEPEPPSLQPDAPAAPSAPAGQWVYTEQYGWIWMPYGDAFVNLPADGGVPNMYAYYPAIGWSWLVAPWIWGWGPMPYFGVYGYGHYGWYGHGYGRWHGYAGHYAGWYRGGHYWRGGQWYGAGHGYSAASRGVAPAPARPAVRPAPGVRSAPWARSVYGAPVRSGYVAQPRAGFAAPHTGYAAPRGGFAAPRAGYAAPRAAFTAPHGSYAAPTRGGFSAPHVGAAPGGGSAGSRGASGGGHAGGGHAPAGGRGGHR